MVKYSDRSTLVTGFGLLIACVAIVGTRFFGWEWGSGQLLPTVIGVVVAGVAIVVSSRTILA